MPNEIFPKIKKLKVKIAEGKECQKIRMPKKNLPKRKFAGKKMPKGKNTER